MNARTAGGRLRRSPLAIALLLLAGTLVLGATLHRQASGAANAALDRSALPLTFTAPGAGPVHFAGNLDRGAVLANGDGIVRMELSLRADPTRGAALRLPTDLVVVLDRSGSMSGEKITQARAAIRALVDRLGPQDRFALVTYSDGVEIRVPLAQATDAARSGWFETVEGVSAQGGTNMSAGLDMGLGLVNAARVSGRSPRVILISDGLANQGDASREGLRARASRAASGEYALSTVGVGADFDEDLMAALADAGTGNFYYLENAVNLSEIFASELSTARETVASGVTIRFMPAPGVELVDAAGYPLERSQDGSVLVRPGSLFSGQDRRLWATLRIASTGPASQELGDFSVSYRSGDGTAKLAFSERPRVSRVSKADDFYARVDKERWAQAVVVDQYNRLQREVAMDVKQGLAEEARRKIEAYGKDVGVMNERIESDEVKKQLGKLSSLADSVAAAAAAPEPVRNRAAKEIQSNAVDAARPGSKK
jgi:Ca-activated chloride channel family protein